MAEREYSNATIVALAAWSRGTCYYPGCPAPLVVKRSGKPVIAAQIAHIAALKKGGQRHNEDLTVAQRNDWPNLIFLCQADHVEVDRKNPDKYPVVELYKWKEQHESDGMAGLRGLSDLTEDRLEQIIENSAERLRADMNAAMSEIRGLSQETVSLVEAVLGAMSDFDVRTQEIDVDATYALASAADKLGHLEDSASMLAAAADKLSGLPDMASEIYAAAEELRSVRPEY